MKELVIRTGKEKEVLDITHEVEQAVAEQGVKEGICHLFLLHTTAALTTSDLDTGTDLDILDALEHIVPNLNYRHPHNPRHAKYHIMATMIGPSISVPLEEGKLQLGPWQRIVLLEFGGPRERSIILHCSP
ncbi:secondary thiamine-phosphate synthase enzyme YjbQ [Patescibacteria group bacterium]|nr:secondary thiamine-phosphate synthase enzyme YjbQ [Patescibacteria group bacterium]